MKNYFYLLFAVILFLSSCGSQKQRKTFAYPVPVDTQDKKIEFQTKKIFQIDDIFVDNTFSGARMNNFSKLNDTLYQIDVAPENFPINPSAWYAFKIGSQQPKKIYLKLNYLRGKHRYNPKISTDYKNWKTINDSLIRIPKNREYAVFPILLQRKPVWVAAQPIINSADVQQWISGLKKSAFMKQNGIAGKSVLGRNIPFFVLGKGSSENKKLIILLSRQHPPETTGFLAMQFFIDELLQDNRLTQDFYNYYDILVFPILNPDGVDLGHWRHNAHGVDLNRDWAYYRQPETDVVTQTIVNQVNKNNYKVVLALDFHSTFKDVYYVFDDTMPTELKTFRSNWTTAIDRIVYPFPTKYAPEKLSRPYSKTWFYMQYKAESITYEVGDTTPKDIIDKKARAGAITMMLELIR